LKVAAGHAIRPLPLAVRTASPIECRSRSTMREDSMDLAWDRVEPRLPGSVTRRLLNRFSAYLVRSLERRHSGWSVGLLAAWHVVAWTLILTIAKRAQELDVDSTEAYAWGTQVLWGYGKHPPLAGWVARIWFSVFPTANWAMYALAMTVVGCTLWICWSIAARVVGRRRAALYVLCMTTYPIFNVSGYNFNPDLLQLPFFALATLIALRTLARPTLGNGVLLGVIFALAVLTKYWALLLPASIAIAAIVHPDRAVLWRSPAAIATVLTFVCLLIPHVIWLVRSDYAPIEYATRYLDPSRTRVTLAAAASLGHHAAMLLAPAAVIGLALGLPWSRLPRASKPADPGATLFIRIVFAALVLLPPIGAIVLHVVTRSRWGIPLYFLAPLVLLGFPGIGVPARALARAAALSFAFTTIVLPASPMWMPLQARFSPDRYVFDGEDLAIKVSQIWHRRFGRPLPAVAGARSAVAPIAFYSPDHPAMFTDANRRIAPWIDLDEIRRTGFIGVCPVDWTSCNQTVSHIAPGAEQTVLSQERILAGSLIRGLTWSIFLVAPADTKAASQP
jgi:4-amino-4-deoxy-L-arabinose transferase-like glycosyltransferase